MTSYPVPPPLPLPTSESVTVVKSETKTIHKSNSNVEFISDLCTWAAESLELQECCIKNRILSAHEPFKYHYRHFKSILQNGPTCGIVALCMLVKNLVTSEKILTLSQELGFTNHGEMLSAKNLFTLSEEILTLCNLDNVQVSLRRDGLFTKEIIEKLLNGAVLLVPYDADFNHSPCLRKGHTAHWALICGVIVVSDPGHSYNSDPDNVYIFAKHGKSNHLQAWKLDSLDRSNKNLWQFSPKKKEDSLSYVIPDQDIGGEDGLRDQFLLFEGSI